MENPAKDQPVDSRIEVSPMSRGIEIRFLPSRHPIAWVSFILAPVLVGSPIIFYIAQVPAPAQIFFAATNLFLTTFVLHLWLGGSNIEVLSDEIIVSYNLGFTFHTKRLEATQIKKVEASFGPQNEFAPRFLVSLELKDGKSILIGRGTKGEAEAEWLVKILNEAIGLDA